MSAFKYQLGVKETTQERANRKVNATCKIMDILSTEEMEKLVQIAEQQPDKLALFRGYINHA